MSFINTEQIAGEDYNFFATNFFVTIFQQNDFDMLLVNLRMDAVNVKENMRISWVSEAGMVENVQAIIKEYKDTRNLHVSYNDCVKF